MTLLLPTLFYFIIKASLTGIIFVGHALKYLEQDFLVELLGWLGYIFISYISAFIQGCIAFICGILLIPLYFWNLLWHPNGRSIYDMLCNPEGHGRLISSTNHPCCCRYREWARPVPRWVWWRKPSRLKFRWSSVSTNKIPIHGYDSRLCMFSYYQIHPSSVNRTNGNPSSEDGVTANIRCDLASKTCFKTIIWSQDFLKGTAQGTTKQIDLFLFSYVSYNRDIWNSSWDQVLSHFEFKDSQIDTCFRGRHDFHIAFQGSCGLHIVVFQGRPQ